MSPPRKWNAGAFVLALLVAAVLVGAAATARGMPASSVSATGTSTYTDPAGDAQGGPDVTTVTITDDPATKMISVTVNAPGYLPTTADGRERDVAVWLDTDRNRATGDPQDGTEYGLVAWNDSTGRWWNVVRWNGSKWEGTSQSPTESFTRSGDVMTWTVNASDIGGVTSFTFYVHSGIWNAAADNWASEDEAPDSGWWEYPQTGPTPPPSPPAPAPAPKVSLMIAAPTTTPRQAIAGKRFTVSFRVSFMKEATATVVNSSGTQTGTVITFAPVSGGKMVCDPSVAGRVITHSESLKSGQARLSFAIPKTAKGKLLKVRVKITATEKETGKTVTASRIATFHIR